MSYILAYFLALNFSLIEIGNVTIETTSPTLVANISEDYSEAIMIDNLFLLKSDCNTTALASLHNLLKQDTNSSEQIPQVAPRYTFSKNIRLIDNDISGSLTRIKNYLNLSKSINTKLTSLLEEGHASEVILDNSTFEIISSIIDQHKGISPQLDTALDSLTEDLKYLKNKNKQEIMSYFNP